MGRALHLQTSQLDRLKVALLVSAKLVIRNLLTDWGAAP
jgi:hypothetical protein